MDSNSFAVFISLNLHLIGVTSMFKKFINHFKDINRDYGKLIKNSYLIKLMIAGFISSLGSKISYFALLKKIYDLSDGKITSLGFFTIAECIPYMLFGTIAGTVIDRFSRKKIMIISDIFSAIVTVSVIFIHNINIIYVMAFMAAFVNVFRNPAQRAFEPNLVDKEDIPLLNSFISMSNSIIMIIGSAVGAATVGFVGVRNSFVIDGMSFVLSAVLIFTIGLKETHMVEKRDLGIEGHFKEFIDGTSIIWKDNTLKLILLIDLYITFAMSMQGPLIYIFIKQSLNLGDRAEFAWGVLLSALGVGAVLGSFIIGVLVKKYKNRFKLFLNVLLFDSVFFTAFLLNKYFPASIVIFGFLGCIGTAHSIILNSTIQSTVADENRGRVFSALSMLQSPISILSILIGTVAAEYITAKNVLLIVAVLEAVIAIGVRGLKTYKVIDKELKDIEYENTIETI